jgi:transcriptional regulator
MYIPAFNKFPDKHEVISFMRKYSFGTLVTAENNLPFATHLPFLIEERSDELIILSHFAKANPQAKAIANNQVLVIFSEPHAYISPGHYESIASVPTWNYIAVHAYGKAKIMESGQEHMELLERTINTYEPAYFKQWEGLPSTFKSKMIKGITGFEIIVTDLQAKSKLSQNKTEQERENIINTLSKSPNTQESDIAKYMAALKDK